MVRYRESHRVRLCLVLKAQRDEELVRHMGRHSDPKPAHEASARLGSPEMRSILLRNMRREGSKGLRPRLARLQSNLFNLRAKALTLDSEMSRNMMRHGSRLPSIWLGKSFSNLLSLIFCVLMVFEGAFGLVVAS